jgi:predicted ATPase
MISSLHIKNFKIFKDQKFEFKDLNLLTGLNGLGKSTVIQILLLLREAKLDRELLTKGINLSDNKLFDLGKFNDALYIFAEKPTIEINLGLANHNTTFVFGEDKSNNKRLRLKEAKKVNEKVMDNNSLFKEDNFVYLNANRIIPQEYYKTGKKDKNKFGNDGEFAIEFYHNNKTTFTVISALCKSGTSNNTLESQVTAWLQEISPEIRVRTTPEGDKIHLDYTFGNLKQSFDAINVGFGITYVFPVLVALLTAKPNDLIILENPEAHLHPKGQSKLAELMCLAAQGGVQIFCETHSDHIFYGTRVAIKENKIEPENVKTYFFRKDDQNMNSVVDFIAIDKRGRIGDAPKGFFDQFRINQGKLL